MPVSIRSLPSAIALTLALACGAATARASVVYDQPTSGAACDSSCWTSAYANSGGGYQAFDDFTLGTDAAITNVSWTGFSYDYVDVGNNPTFPVTQTWSLNFYADDGGLPGTLLRSLSVTAASAGGTYVTTSDFGGHPVYLYSFSVDLGAPFVADAGVTYWFSPLSEQVTFNPFFSWSPAAVDVDGVTAQMQLPFGSLETRPNDRAFTLSDDTPSGVPEPAAWSLMLLGIGAAGSALRNARRPLTSRGPASATS